LHHPGGRALSALPVSGGPGHWRGRRALLADAEARLSTGGVKVAWLACAVGNERAARFYEKSGWQRAGTEEIDVDTSEGPFSLEIWRFEKPLGHP
jgi:RimJ/RimL family protein N-acetyltransferase